MASLEIAKNASVLIDESDYERVSRFRWNRYKKYAYRAPRNGKNEGGKDRRKILLMHRYIVGLNDEKGNKICTCNYHVDHINHDTLDNRRSNLRICFDWQNNKNVLKTKKNATSTYLGVSWCKGRKRWLAQISHENKTRNLGRFNTEKEAAEKYNEVAQLLHGEYANLNII